MTRQRKIVWAKAAMVMGTLPVLLWAYEYGPDPGYCGVPNENGGSSGATCASLGCHSGTANDPNNKGSVAINFPNGMTYTPGVAQTLSVTITDSTEKAAGFQLTARQASSVSTMAGTFATVDTNTQVVCSQPNLQIFTSTTSSLQCKSSYTLQYIEQTGTQTGPGYSNSIAHGLPYTYSFTWTPPATNVGNITIYVAGNAANGDLTSNGDHIYSTKYTLTPSAGGGGSAPAIMSGGIVSASAFGGFSAATAGSWLEIYGTNVGPSTAYTWAGSDFNGNNAPTELQGVSLTVNGVNAFIDYVSATQVNAQVPAGVGTGPATMILTNSNGTSAPYTLTLNALEPGLLTTSSFLIGGKQYVVALHADNTYVVPTAAAALGTPAKPGETILIYGVGFGPVTPTINPGIIVTAANKVSNPMQMFFGGTSATLAYDGLAPNFVGLYQFNVVVPTSLSNSDAIPLTFNIGGNTGNQTLYTAVHN
ncbi:MAG: choice-of-anchor V domain-containing protein [Bryobacteraceae bacterium]|jgi:uncharacterized protein (TIGR03437 family)